MVKEDLEQKLGNPLEGIDFTDYQQRMEWFRRIPLDHRGYQVFTVERDNFSREIDIDCPPELRERILDEAIESLNLNNNQNPRPTEQINRFTNGTKLYERIIEYDNVSLGALVLQFLENSHHITRESYRIDYDYVKTYLSIVLKNLEESTLITTTMEDGVTKYHAQYIDDYKEGRRTRYRGP